MLPISVPEITNSNADLIQSSYLIIKTQPDEFTESFYQILFDKYPNVRSLFSETDLKKQREKLIESLDLVLVNVHNPKAFHSMLKELGKRHVKYGAVLTDYPLVGDALLQALEKHLGKDWTPNLKHAWSLAYQNIADTMAEGARSELKNDSRSAIDFQKNSENNNTHKQYSSYNNKLAANKIFGFACVGIAAVFGYAIWTAIQSQPNITPNPAEESRTN